MRLILLIIGMIRFSQRRGITLILLKLLTFHLSVQCTKSCICTFSISSFNLFNSHKYIYVFFTQMEPINPKLLILSIFPNVIMDNSKSNDFMINNYNNEFREFRIDSRKLFHLLLC